MNAAFSARTNKLYLALCRAKSRFDTVTYTANKNQRKSSVFNAMVEIDLHPVLPLNFLFSLEEAPFGEILELDLDELGLTWHEGDILNPDSLVYTRVMLEVLEPFELSDFDVLGDSPNRFFGTINNRLPVSATQFPAFGDTIAYTPLLIARTYILESLVAYFDQLLLDGVGFTGKRNILIGDAFLSIYLTLYNDSDRCRGYYVKVALGANCCTVVNAIAVDTPFRDGWSELDAVEFFEQMLMESTRNSEAAFRYGLQDYDEWTVRPQSGITPPRKPLCLIAGEKSSPSPVRQPSSTPPSGSRSTPPRRPPGKDRSPHYPIPQPNTIPSCEYDEQELKKVRKLTTKRRRDAKQSRDVFRPQGLFDGLFPHLRVERDVKDIMSDFTKNTGDLSTQLPEFKELLNRVSTTGINVSVGLDQNVVHVPALIGLVSVTYMAITEGGYWKGALATYGTVYVSTCVYTHRDWFTSKIVSIARRVEDDVNPQSLDCTVLEDLSGAILGYLALASSRLQSTSAGKIASIAKSLSAFDRTKTGISSALSFSVRLIERLLNWFRDTVLGLPRVSLLESTIPELVSWTSKVDIVDDEAHRGVLYVNSANSARLHALKMEGNQLSTKKFSAIESLQVRSALATYMHTLRKLSVPFDQANFAGNGARMEPIVVLLSGIPGTGKTWALLPLIMDVLRIILPPERLSALKDDFNNEIFARYPESKFWEGYRGQFACIFDDFGQARDMAGQPDNEYVELIRAANIFPYLLHMAGIEAKGCTNFNSRLIFCTTNTVNFEPRSITEPEAVMRRFDIIVSVYPKPEYCVDPGVDRPNRKLDKTKIGSRFSEDIYEFCVKQADGCSISNEISEVLTYSELRDRIVKMYLARAAKADDYISDLAARADSLLYEPQGMAQSTIDMQELNEFDSEFDASQTPPDFSNFDLSDLLEPAEKSLWSPAELEDRMQSDDRFDHHGFLASMRAVGYTTDRQSLMHAWMAYRRNPTAFMECMYHKAPFLPSLVLKLAHFHEHAVAVPDSNRIPLEKAKGVIKAYTSSVGSCITAIRTKYSWVEHWQKAVAIAGLAVIAFGIYYARNVQSAAKQESEKAAQEVSSLLADDEDEDVTSAESGGPRDRHPKFVVAKLKDNVVRPEGGVDETAKNMIIKAILKSSYRLTVPAFDNQQLGFGTFIKGRIMMIPLHFISQLRHMVEERVDGTSQVCLENASTGSTRTVTMQEILDGYVEDPELARHDLCLVTLELHQHPDIVSYFVQQKQLTFSVIPAALYGYRKDPDGIFSAHCTARRSKSQFVNFDLGNYDVLDVLKYEMPTNPGDCGALLVAQNPGFGPGKFLGVHVAGSTNAIGFSSVITRELLEAALTKCGPQLDPPVPEKFFSPQCAEFSVPGQFVPVQVIDKVVSQPMRSSIVPSVLHNVWSVSPYAPPRLRPFYDGHTMKDPLFMAIERYGKDPSPFDRLPLKLAADYVAGYTMRSIVGVDKPDPRIFSFEDAVVGLPEERYCKSIPRTTSAGYPYILKEKPGCRGKERFFGKGEAYDLSSSECIQLRSECDNIISEAREHRRTEVVYVDFLKDETRKHKRVAEGNTRLISAAPVAYTIVCRMYFLAFVMAVMTANLHVGIGVGINCYSSDWDVLARLLKKKGGNIIAGDFTGFDTSHFEFLANLVLLVIEEYYKGFEPTVRKVLFADLTNSVHIVRNMIYMWCAGRLPSGHPLTAVFSSFMNRILYVACWIELHPLGVAGVSDFDKHVYLVTYGDDSIVSVSDWALSFFNYETISKAMSSFGYNYTDEMKGSDSEGPLARPLDQVTFLKRGFRYEPAVGRYVAPLRVEAIVEMLYWTQRGHSGREITRTNVDNALRELSLHEASVFDEWAPKVIAASREFLNHHPVVVDYRALQRITCGLDVLW